MYFVARYLAITNGCRMAWQFFGTGHGKSKMCWNLTTYLSTAILKVYALHLLINKTLRVLSLWLGEWDGAGAVIKTKLRNEQLRNPTLRLQNSGDVVAFLNEALSTRVPMLSRRASRGPIHRYFYNVPAAAVDRSNLCKCDTIPYSRSLHSISSVPAVDPTKLMVHFFSCSCGSCRCQMWDRLRWRLYSLWFVVIVINCMFWPERCP
jgi:hypothetical protein